MEVPVVEDEVVVINVVVFVDVVVVEPDEEPDEPVVITKVTMECAGRVPPTVPPLKVAEKVAGEETELLM